MTYAPVFPYRRRPLQGECYTHLVYQAGLVLLGWSSFASWQEEEVLLLLLLLLFAFYSLELEANDLHFV